MRLLLVEGQAMVEKYAGLRVSQAWVQIPAMLLTSCVASGRSLNLSEAVSSSEKWG